MRSGALSPGPELYPCAPLTASAAATLPRGRSFTLPCPRSALPSARRGSSETTVSCSRFVEGGYVADDGHEQSLGRAFLSPALGKPAAYLRGAPLLHPFPCSGDNKEGKGFPYSSKKGCVKWCAAKLSLFKLNYLLTPRLQSQAVTHHGGRSSTSRHPRPAFRGAHPDTSVTTASLERFGLARNQAER